MMIFLKGKGIYNTPTRMNTKENFIRERNMVKENIITVMAIIMMDNGKTVKSMEKVFFTSKTKTIHMKEDLKTIKNMAKVSISSRMAISMKEILRMALNKEKVICNGHLEKNTEALFLTTKCMVRE